jgi:probable rRNA maturation factor
VPAARPIAVRNAHPRLRIPRGAVARIITLLDENFEMRSRDLPFLTLLSSRLAALQSKISNRKSKISSVCPPGELSIVFLTDPALAQIHADFMDDPTATDVITFEGDTAAELAGEICVSADTAARFAGLPLVGALEQSDNVAMLSTGRLKRSYQLRRLARTRALQDAFATELTLYIVHGWLHLAGYDDLQPAKKRRMRAAEKRAMALLHKSQAVPAFRLI